MPFALWASRPAQARYGTGSAGLNCLLRKFTLMLLVDRDVLDLRHEANNLAAAIAHDGDMYDDLDDPAIRAHVALLGRIAVPPAC